MKLNVQLIYIYIDKKEKIFFRSFLKRYDKKHELDFHPFDLEPTVVAATLGARIIERHITLSHDMWGTDQNASLEVHAMDLLEKRLKSVDEILGTNNKIVTESEKPVRKKLRG